MNDTKQIEATPTSAAAPKLRALLAKLSTDALRTISDDELENLLDAARDRLGTYAEANGISRDTLAAMVNIGNGYYFQQQFAQAAAIYGLVLTLDQGFGPAWRGLGATLQALHQYAPAAETFRFALDAAETANEHDLASQILMGECLILAGNRAAGTVVLRDAVAHGTPTVDETIYVQRAKVILASGASGDPDGRASRA